MNNKNLLELGLNEGYIKEASIYNDDFYLGRVSVQYKDIYKVFTEEGEVLARVSGKLSYSSNSTLDYPVVGDWVLLDRADNKNGDAIIHKVLFRKSYFSRKIAGSRFDIQIVAANIDYIFICTALNNDFNINRLERYIAVAWDSMAIPVIVLTKSDLCEDIDERLKEVQEVAIGIEILVTSSLNENGYEKVKKYIKIGTTIAFIGSSGVGKSTLINKLLNKDILKTNSVDENDKGRHTTTHRELFVLEEGGIIIDTPGMRELGLMSADVDKSFSDIEELESQCKFSDCTHRNEPKCAVREAIEKGELDLDRLERYKKLKREEEYNLKKSMEQDKQRVKSIIRGRDKMSIYLKDINEENLLECALLTTNKEGKHYVFEEFVASNAFSIAQSKIQEGWIVKAIYNEDLMIGFTMYGYCNEYDFYEICRFMIDHKYQGNGFGRISLRKIIEEMKKNEDCKDIYISFDPKNNIARSLYESLGFKDTGKNLEEELLFKLEDIK